MAASIHSLPAQYASVMLKSVLKKNPIPAGMPIYHNKEDIESCKIFGCDMVVYHMRESQKAKNIVY